MKLSTKGRYAVMAMVDLSLRNCGEPVTLCDISERQEISLSYLEQLFSKLRRAGLVCSVRGPGGGYRLARDCCEISIAEIIMGVDEDIRATRCRPNKPGGCRGDGSKCLTHDLWAALGDHTFRFLSNVTLDDVVKRRFCPALAATSPLAVGVGQPSLTATVESVAAE